MAIDDLDTDAAALTEGDELLQATQDVETFGFPLPRVGVSGLYATPGAISGLAGPAWGGATPADGSGAFPGGPLPLPPPHPTPFLFGEELRLDVDGRYPLMTASGSVPLARFNRVQWIAKLTKVRANTYQGGIWYKNPNVTPFAYTEVKIVVTPSVVTSNRKATVTFSGPGLADRIRNYVLKSRYFHKVEFEFDTDKGIVPVMSIDTGDHPNRPATLPAGPLSVQAVFQRAGFDVSTSGAVSTIPGAPGGTWSDAEMHDAMQVYWSRFASKAQWAMWVFLAQRHDMGPNLGGVMFDDIGPNHRQGTAIFYDSFISQLPAGDPAPLAYQKRMRFWTTVHEMGHAFNLAHSWQKSLGLPWIPLVDEPEARSFMNYPYNVTGGQSAFFSSFEYRFTDSELLFMRHAPAQFVRMGDAPWFDHHGFQAPSVLPEPALQLTLRFNRGRPAFEFLEPIVAELKLKNVSRAPVIVDESQLASLDRVTIAMIRQGGSPRQHVPYARRCLAPTPRALQPGEAIYASVFLSAGLNGFDLSEPGRYVLQAAFHTDDGDIVSAPVVLRVAAPRTAEEENVAQDYYRDAVGRALEFDGTRYLTEANGVLHEIVGKLATSRVATHARIALALPKSRPYLQLLIPSDVEAAMRSAGASGGLEAARKVKGEMAKIGKVPAERAEALQLLQTALTADEAPETLGHIDYRAYAEAWADTLEADGQRKEADKVDGDLQKVLSARGVIAPVLQEIAQRTERRDKAAGA